MIPLKLNRERRQWAAILFWLPYELHGINNTGGKALMARLRFLVARSLSPVRNHLNTLDKDPATSGRQVVKHDYP